MMRTFYCLLTLLFALMSLDAQAQSKKDTTLIRTPTSQPSGAPLQVPDAPQGSPTRAIQDLETKTQDYKTGDTLSADEKNHNAQIKREIITGTFDIRELARLALDRHWAGRSAGEQDNFVALLTQLLEKKAILSKEQSKTRGRKYSVKYLGDSFLDPQKLRARTRTRIVVPKEDVEVSIEYKLIKKGAEWKIFDVIVDDASLVDNYRYQFNSIITKHGYSELVSRMRKKLNDLDSKS